MFKDKKGKNPITVVRKPEAINKEYSELTLRLGSFAIETVAAQKQIVRCEARIAEIDDQREEIIGRVEELSDEMTHAQAEEKRKAELEGKSA